MKRLIAHALTFVLATTATYAQGRAAADGAATGADLMKLVERLVTSHGANPEELLKTLDRACVEAMVQANVEALSMIEADDFTFISPDGSVMTKEQDLSTIRSGDLKYEAVDLEDVSVRVFGDAGVVVGRANVKGRYRTYDISGAYRYTVTFARRQGRWQAVASQMTRIQGAGSATSASK